MSVFFGTFRNKLDRKGRVSVPASFRAVAAGQGLAGVVLRPDPKLPALEGFGLAELGRRQALIDALDPEGDAYQDAVHTLFAVSQQLDWADDGRISLPREFADHAGIGEEAAFVGVGRAFQIWEPGRYEAFQAELRSRKAAAGARA